LPAICPDGFLLSPAAYFLKADTLSADRGDTLMIVINNTSNVQLLSILIS
jgi:hypothetical protein